MTLFDLPYWLMSAFLFVLGAIAGSFLNVCIYRIPKEPRLWPALRGLWQPPSTCPRCRTQIAWYDNIPILAWLWLRGRCRTCRMWISPRYPVIELLNALLFLGLYWLEVPPGWPARVADSCLFAEFGPQAVPGLGPLSPVAFLHLRFFYHLVLVESLLVASFIDFDRREIPDASTLPALAVGLLAALLVGRVHIVPVWTQSASLVSTFTHLWAPAWDVAGLPRVPEWCTAHPHWHGLAVSVAGLLVAGGTTWIVRLIGFFVLRREALGFGDVILMAVIGAFLGWQPAVIAFVVAPLCAVLALPIQMLVDRDRYIPYGPYLSLGALLVMAFWRPLWNGAGTWDGAARLFDLGPLLPFLFGIMAVLFCLTLLLVQGIKRLLGWNSWPEDLVIEWTAADQAHFQAGEKVQRHSGLWRISDWPGVAAGRGSLHEERWRAAEVPPRRISPPPRRNPANRAP